MPNRYARQTGAPDANEAEIISALQDRGAIVLVLDRPVDLVVGYGGRWVLAEVKDGQRAKVRGSQKKFLTRCALQLLPTCVIRSLEDVDHYFPVIPLPVTPA